MKNLILAACTAALCLAAGCRDSNAPHGHTHDGEDAHSHESDHGDDHAPPHGGTPVIVAEDKFHLELVLDASTGKMQAYVLDGHLESYVKVPESHFMLVVELSDGTQRLAFQRAPDPGAGDASAESALFEAQADWLRTAKEFEAKIPSITLNGTTFTDVSFSFPKGSKHVH